MAENETEKVCINCTHFDAVPGFARTGVCDANELNRRCGVPVVLVGADETCWQFEEEKGYFHDV